MKKLLLIFISIILVLFSFFAIKAYFSIQTTDLGLLKKCHKTKMYEVYLCPGSKNYVKLDQISLHFINLIIIAEDASFYSHKGLDWQEIEQSFKINLRAFSYLRGGSTITQQLVKNVYLSPDKSIQRKFVEAMLAAKIEKKYSKKIILERYVNVIEFGKNIYGIKQAAHHYFNKHPSELNVLESASLVYLVPSPKKYSSIFRNKKLTPYSKKRILTLLRKLKLFKDISEEQYTFVKSKIDEFPWTDTDFYYQPSDDPNTILNESDSVIPDQKEEEIQKQISDEISDELNSENIDEEIQQENSIIEESNPNNINSDTPNDENSENTEPPDQNSLEVTE